MCNAVYEAAQVKELNFRKWSEKYQSAQFFEGHIIGALDMLYDLELVSTDECCEVSRELEKTLKGM